jgi:sulfur carrier protein ThiS
MRMHRGSSKGSEVVPPTPESLPLSASTPRSVTIEFELISADRSEVRRVVVAPQTMLKSALRAAGFAAEGCAVLRGARPLPLDTRMERTERLTVISAFSGG